MKSPQVESSDIPGKEGYSELKVMHSAGGFYVGTSFRENGINFPGSRDSGYFTTEEKAQAFLVTVTNVPNPQEYLRDKP